MDDKVPTPEEIRDEARIALVRLLREVGGPMIPHMMPSYDLIRLCDLPETGK